VASYKLCEAGLLEKERVLGAGIHSARITIYEIELSTWHANGYKVEICNLYLKN
jgi:hypothetical protein